MAGRPPDIRDVAASIAKARAAAVASAPGRARGGMPVASPVTTASPAPPYPGYMSPAEQLALAQQQAQAFYQPQLDIYKQQQAYLAQQHAAQQMGLQALYKALADSFGAVPGQIQGVYQNAAQDQAAFGKGYSQGLQLAQNAAASQTNQQLQNIGAPEGQMQNPGTGAADATYALGGTIPADTLEQQGAGFASAAAYLPSQAQLQGQMEFLKAVQQANAEDSQLSDQINSLAGQIPGKAQDILGSIQSQQDKYAQAAQPTYKTVGGNLYAIDPITGKTSLVIQGQASKPPSTFSGPGGSKYAWAQDANGNWRAQMIVPGTTANAKPPTTVAGPNGSKYAWQKTATGWKLTQVIAPKATAAKPAKPTYWTDKAGNRHMTTGQGVDTVIVPAGASTTTKPPSASTMVKARQVLASIGKVSYTTPDGQTLSVSALRGLVNDYNRQAKANGHKQITLADVYQTPAVQKVLGIAQEKLGPQDAYLKMVQLGVPARQAWKMVRAKYPDWGQGYFSGPKDNAASGGKTASYKTTSGLDYPLATPGKIIGTPYSGTHTMYGNWESDNAVDIATPDGTPVYALADGTIGSQIGSLNSGDPHLLGLRVHLQFGGNEAYYAHLSRLVVKAGQRVKKGQLIGYSGSANGVQHLHIALKNGNPLNLFGSPSRVV